MRLPRSRRPLKRSQEIHGDRSTLPFRAATAG
jgi:hypothetical protein